ncbi:MAG: hypothetical protein H9535_01235 [Ignavibacteria bacterium]|nr:hypothetical protein [Ignavibacteria bacterium]
MTEIIPTVGTADARMAFHLETPLLGIGIFVFLYVANWLANYAKRAYLRYGNRQKIAFDTSFEKMITSNVSFSDRATAKFFSWQKRTVQQDPRTLPVQPSLPPTIHKRKGTQIAEFYNCNGTIAQIAERQGKMIVLDFDDWYKL